MYAVYVLVDADGEPLRRVLPPHTIHECEIVDVAVVQEGPNKELKLVTKVRLKG